MVSRKFIPEHLGISVRNLEESIDFYQRILGFELDLVEYRAPMKSRVAFMHNGNFRLEMIEHEGSAELPAERRMPNTDLQQQGTKHICYLHEDVPALAEEYKELGVDIVMGPAFNGVQHMIFIRDVNGILIEIVSPQKQKGEFS